ncbi:MAG: hypothetical protein ACXW4B_10095 [Micavibrio sp.]
MYEFAPPQKGWHRVERYWQNDPFFGDDVYSKRDAWIWLVGEAAYIGHDKRIMGKPVYLSRGQLSHSLRFMAEKWGWSTSAVDRFLKDLCAWNKILIDIETGQNIITVCNYDDFGIKEEKSETPLRLESKQQRDCVQTKNNENNKANNLLPSKPSITQLDPGGSALRVGAHATPPTPQRKEPWFHKLAEAIGKDNARAWLQDASYENGILMLRSDFFCAHVKNNFNAQICRALGVSRVEYKTLANQQDIKIVRL